MKEKKKTMPKKARTETRYDEPDGRQLPPVESNKPDHDGPDLEQCLFYMRTKFKRLFHIWNSPGPEYGKYTHHAQIGHVLVEGEDLSVVIRNAVRLFLEWERADNAQTINKEKK